MGKCGQSAAKEEAVPWPNSGFLVARVVFSVYSSGCGTEGDPHVESAVGAKRPGDLGPSLGISSVHADAR
jgi:hypothetical protein